MAFWLLQGRQGGSFTDNNFFMALEDAADALLSAIKYEENKCPANGARRH